MESESNLNPGKVTVNNSYSTCTLQLNVYMSSVHCSLLGILNLNYILPNVVLLQLLFLNIVLLQLLFPNVVLLKLTLLNLSQLKQNYIWKK